MSTDFTIVEGDTVPVQAVFTEVTYPSGVRTLTPVDFTGWTALRFVMTQKGSSTPKVDATATVVAPATNGRIRYSPVATDFDTKGVYRARFVGVDASGNTRSLPGTEAGDADPKYIEIRVIDDLGA